MLWNRYHTGVFLSLTIRDIAKCADVSKSTVSRVLSKSGYVSDDSRSKVEKAIAELNYVPSAMAQGLSNSVANTIGVLIPEMENNFFTDVLSGISEIVDEKDMTLLLSDTANSAAKQEKALQMIRGQRIRGLIMTPATEFDSADENLRFREELKQLNIPIVVVDRDIPDSRWDSILFENFNAGYMATRSMIDAGRRTIGIITGDMKLSIARERYNGYRAAMEEADLPIQKEFILEGDFTNHRAVVLCEELFQRKNLKLEGLVSCNNLTSIGLMHVIIHRNIRLGQDIGAVGIDRVRSFEELYFPFSHIERDTKLTGRLAVEKLMERIKEPDKEKEVSMIPAHLLLEGTE